MRLPPLRPGAYRLRWETPDDRGARVETQQEILVAGPRTPLALPAVLRVESATVRVGGTARLLVHSGFPGQAFYPRGLARRQPHRAADAVAAASRPP